MHDDNLEYLHHLPCLVYTNRFISGEMVIRIEQVERLCDLNPVTSIDELLFADNDVLLKMKDGNLRDWKTCVDGIYIDRGHPDHTKLTSRYCTLELD